MKQFRFGYLFLFLVLGFINAEGQKLLKHFSVDNGLLSSETYQVIQDYKGYIWIATDEGVSRYDGYEFKHYNDEDGLPESTTFEIFEDYKQRIWFVLSTNELAYIENDSIYLYQFNDSIKKYNPEKNYPIKKSFYVDSSDNVFIGIYYKDILKINKDGHTQHLFSGFDSIQITHKVDEKYIFTGKYKMAGLKHRIRGPYSFDSIFHFNSKMHRSLTVVEDHNDQLYITDYRKLYVFDKSGGCKEFSFDHEIIWMSEDNHNNLWFGFLYGGAVVFEDSTFTKKKYHILPNESVSSVLEDTEGSYWFSTLNNGVYMYSPLSFRNLGPSQGVDQLPITQIESHNENIYFAGKNSALYEFVNNELNIRPINVKELPTMCNSLNFFGDTILISHANNGIRLINNGKVEKLNAISAAYSVCKVKDMLILFNGKFVYKYEYGRLSKLVKNNNYTQINDVIQYSDSLLWIVTTSGLKEVNVNTLIAKDFDNPVLNSQSNSILMASDSVVWLSTNRDGLISILGNSIKTFYPKILEGRTIKKLIDLDSLLITGTNDGLLKFRKERDSIRNQDAIRYSIGIGLLNNDINDIAYLNGRIYAATAKGVAIVPLKKRIANSPLLITKVSINGRDTLLKDSYNLAYNENDIKFYFVSLNYQRDEQITYYYKLVGSDKEWRKTQDRNAVYSALQPGEYVFKLKSVNAAGLQSKNNYLIRIVINKAPYNTIWFRVLVVFLFLLLITTIFLIILRVKLREASRRQLVEHELNQSRQQALSAQMNPHFIYNSLNSVQSYILKNDKIQASEYLSKLGRLMRNILNNSQNQVITLREEFDALEKYMEMEQLRFRELFTFKINVCSRIDLDEIHVPPLIIQPFVENAIHHGLRLRKEKGELLVDASIKDNALQIVVQDNGVGIENAKKYNSKLRKNYKSFGTEITQKRLKLLEEVYSQQVIISITEAYTNSRFPGTKVVLTIKLN